MLKLINFCSSCYPNIYFSKQIPVGAEKKIILIFLLSFLNLCKHLSYFQALEFGYRFCFVKMINIYSSRTIAMVWHKATSSPEKYIHKSVFITGRTRGEVSSTGLKYSISWAAVEHCRKEGSISADSCHCITELHYDCHHSRLFHPVMSFSKTWPQL